MNIIRKIMSLLLCLSISTYGIPSFAFTGGDTFAEKVSLSDEALAGAVGAGSLDATLTKDYLDVVPTGTVAMGAVVTNRTTLSPAAYSMDLTGASGAVIANMTSGTLASGESRVISAVPPPGFDSFGFAIRVTVNIPALPGVLSVQEVTMHP